MNDPGEPETVSLGELIADSPDQMADLDDCIRVTAAFCDFHGCHVSDGAQTVDLWGYGEIPIAFVADQPEPGYTPSVTAEWWVSVHHLVGPTGLTLDHLLNLWILDRHDRLDVDELKFHIPSKGRDLTQPLASTSFAMRVFSEHSPHREEFRERIQTALTVPFDQEH